MLPTATTTDAASVHTAVAVLPVGSFEQHGPYLPLVTDTLAGYSVGLKDTRDYYRHDIRFIIAVTLLVVLLTLIVLLRAIVAPLYLVASVVISYLSAVGIGTVVQGGFVAVTGWPASVGSRARTAASELARTRYVCETTR